MPNHAPRQLHDMLTDNAKFPSAAVFRDILYLCRTKDYSLSCTRTVEAGQGRAGPGRVKVKAAC